MIEAKSSTSANPQFHYTAVWPQISEQDADDLLAFWKQQGAIPDEAQARERLKQVLMLARDSEGAIAGVCTVLPTTPEQLAQPVYYYRTFIAPEWRSTRLIYSLHMHGFDHLEAWAREHDFPCIGVLLELQNSRFGEVGRRAVWSRPHFTYIGKSPRGFEVRIRYFRGAKLK